MKNQRMNQFCALVVGCGVLLGSAGARAEDDGKNKSASIGDLNAAFKREFAFLEAEKRALQGRLETLKAEAAKKSADARREVENLQTQSLATGVQADHMLDRMADAERQVENVAEGASALESMLAQAASRLEKADITMIAGDANDKTQVAKQVDFAFDKAMGILQSYGTVVSKKGEFFTSAGKKVQGTVVDVGRIASYGITEQEAGPLAPAGAGLLKIWDLEGSQGAQAARAALDGNYPSATPLFLYDSLENNIQAKTEKTWYQVAQSGGVIAWVLIAMGGLVLLFAAIRVVILSRASGSTEKLVDRMTPLIDAGKLDEALALVAKPTTAAARVLRVVLDNVKRPREQLDDAVSEALLHEEAKVDRLSAIILVAAAVGPLLGLLGTVTGMISTFDVITEFGTGNPKMLSGGISEALITTEFGLIVAIPALLLGNLLNGWASRIKDSLERGALRIGNVANGIKVRDITRTATRTNKGTAQNPSTHASALS